MLTEAEAFTPSSDHGLRLAEAAASKASTAKFAKGLAEGKSDLFRYNPFSILVVDGFNSRDFSLPENEEHVAKPAGISPQAALSALRQAFATADRESRTDGVVSYHFNEAAAEVIRQHLGR